MQKTRFELIQCWQDERVDQVFNKEAASVDRATFLATHMPLHNLEYQHELRQIADRGEEAFLRELQRCAAEDLHAFVVVQGIPGTGKSHLIRWLKERYLTQENQQRECVLFIERAQSSLSGTLEQIIRSDVFDEATMREQLEKLQGARMALSQDALADTLLDQLRIACTEDSSVELPRWLTNGDSLILFLLDYRVREELKKPGGPIDRLVRFLRSGPGVGIYASEVPQFEERDFDFKTRVREEIQGYRKARDLADKLSGDDGREKRQKLASLLNQCTRYAIGHATALTGDDFKQVFSDLRRYLYRQGRSLALFIEDITVLTGVDRGLLDVLVTQHKGEGEQEMCRLISVVGITDSYYRDQVPDNIKERISYRIALSSENTSLALSDSQALANLASRYLNAMRLSQGELEAWAENGADVEDLPNACRDCPWRESCHRAFGYYTLNAGSDYEQRIGLYPFNSQSLDTLYQHIDLTKNRQTQRSFLYNVLHYILQSHGARLGRRAFPPALAEWGGEFTSFSLAKPLQREIIYTQGGFDTGRIITLVTIWGDRTVDAVKSSDGSMLVGSLPRETFLAFGLPAIAGEYSSRATREPGFENPRSAQLIKPVQASRETAAHLSANDVAVVKGSQINDKLKKYHDDLASWVDGGSLRYYEDYAEVLVTFIRGFIDWSSHKISPFQVNEVFKGRRNLHIEGQVGQTNAAYYYTLRRSPELHYVMQGLIELKELGQGIDPAILNGYLGHFSLWMNQHEAEIVDFVRLPNQASSDALPLVQMVVLDCLLLACLQGELKASYKGTQELFLDLIRFCKRTEADTTSWETEVRLSAEKHSDPWSRLMRRFKPEDIKNLCGDCLQLLNCAQGDSTDVKFVDAATGIQILKEFRQNKWQILDPGIQGKTSRPSWMRAKSIYDAFQKHFAEAVQGEQTEAREQLRLLGFYVEQDTYQDIFHAIEEMIQTCQQSKRGLAFEQKNQFAASILQTAADDLLHVLDLSSGEAYVLRCAQACKQLGTVKKHIEYFRIFRDATRSVKRSSEARLANLMRETNAIASREAVQKLYQEVAQTLLSFNQVGEKA